MCDNLDMAETVAKAVEAYASSLPQPDDSAIPTRECSRCKGEGWGLFSRYTIQPLRCFKCGGKGRVKVASPELAAFEAAWKASELDRCRAMYRGLSLAMSFAAASEGWEAVAVQEALKVRIAGVVASGKAARQ